MGRYRLYGLPPGHYSVALIPSGEETSAEVSAPVWFPGASDPGRASFFELKPGEIRTSVNLTAFGATASSISGRVSGMAGGADQSQAAVELATADGLHSPITVVLTDDDGRFAISSAPPGEYRLLAWAPFSGWEPHGEPAPANARAADRAISVAGVHVEADVELQPLVRVQGRLTDDGSADNVFPCSVAERIVFRSEDGWLNVWATAAVVTADHFTIQGLPAGRYAIEMPGLGNSCRIAAVRVGDQLARGAVVQVDGSAPLTVVLTAATGEVSGVVTASDGALPRGIVVLSPADGDRAAQVTKIDAAGGFRFAHVLVGEYRMIALSALNSADYLDPLEESNLGAKPIVVEAGRKLTSDLRLVRR
jgi:hypothetical protein